MRRLLPSTSLRVHLGQVLVPSCLPTWGYRSRHRQQDVWWCTRQKSSSRAKGANIRWHTEESCPRPTDGINKQVSCCCVTTSSSTLYVAHMCTTLYSALRTREAVWWWHSTNWLWNCARRFVLSLECAYGALQKRLWSCHDISTKTEVKVYSVAVIPCLLYSIECTTLYRRHIMAQLCHLRSILNIKWRDRVLDVEVLRRAHTVSVEALVTVAQRRWAGHVQRIANNRLPRAVFYSELRQGKRSHGGRKLRFKDVLKRHMKKTGISRDTWGGGGSPESQMARTVKEGHISRRRAAPARILSCACPTALGGYFKQFPMQQLSALLQIQSGSDCPHESLFKIGLNSNVVSHLRQRRTAIIS